MLFAIPLIHICLSSAHNCNFKTVEFSEKSPPPSRPPSQPLFPASPMEKSNIFRGSYLNGDYHPSFSSSSSSRADVNYSCGSCGYDLNLCSSNRNTSTIGSNKYGKSIKRGIISFFNIDESRFTQVDEFKCKPHFSKRSWGLFSRRTKLLCRKCGNHIGNAYDEYTSSSCLLVLDESDSSAGHEITKCRKFDVRIRALQPSNSEEFGTSILE